MSGEFTPRCFEVRRSLGPGETYMTVSFAALLLGQLIHIPTRRGLLIKHRRLGCQYRQAGSTHTGPHCLIYCLLA